MAPTPRPQIGECRRVARRRLLGSDPLGEVHTFHADIVLNAMTSSPSRTRPQSPRPVPDLRTGQFSGCGRTRVRTRGRSARCPRHGRISPSRSAQPRRLKTQNSRRHCGRCGEGQVGSRGTERRGVEEAKATPIAATQKPSASGTRRRRRPSKVERSGPSVHRRVLGWRHMRPSRVSATSVSPKVAKSTTGL